MARKVCVNLAGKPYSNTPTHNSWRAMRRRVKDPAKRASYADKGITVCDKWKTFAGFLADMGERPDGMTLERKKNDEGYCKENCVWASRSAQARNRVQAYHPRNEKGQDCG